VPGVKLAVVTRRPSSMAVCWATKSAGGAATRACLARQALRPQASRYAAATGSGLALDRSSHQAPAPSPASTTTATKATISQRRTTTSTHRRTGGSLAHARLGHGPELAAQVADLVADAGGVLEAEVLGRLVHLLLQGGDEALQVGPGHARDGRVRRPPRRPPGPVAGGGAGPWGARPPMAVPSSSPRRDWMMSVTRLRMV